MGTSSGTQLWTRRLEKRGDCETCTKNSLHTCKKWSVVRPQKLLEYRFKPINSLTNVSNIKNAITIKNRGRVIYFISDLWHFSSIVWGASIQILIFRSRSYQCCPQQTYRQQCYYNKWWISFTSPQKSLLLLSRTAFVKRLFDISRSLRIALRIA